MDVLVVRHGIAMDRKDASTAGMPDRDRPLTEKGRSRMKAAARGLFKRAPHAASLFSSPLRRAVETAEILGRAYTGLECVETSALLPEAVPDELAHLLSESLAESPVLVVGHEPHLSSFVSFCLTGEPRPILELKKGGACLLTFEDTPGPGKGRLAWLLPPSLLRRL